MVNVQRRADDARGELVDGGCELPSSCLRAHGSDVATGESAGVTTWLLEVNVHPTTVRPPTPRPPSFKTPETRARRRRQDHPHPTRARPRVRVVRARRA